MIPKGWYRFPLSTRVTAIVMFQGGPVGAAEFDQLINTLDVMARAAYGDEPTLVVEDDDEVRAAVERRAPLTAQSPERANT